ncbi:MAG TPA: hypothetical protein VG405_03860 [Solirubrobacteraceae bacterium]|nr:hypothetical protein [Solirubrobacteraceae bacterium]
MEPAIYGRPVALEAWSVCTGRGQLPAAIDRVEHAREAVVAIAARARQAFASPAARARPGRAARELS